MFVACFRRVAIIFLIAVLFMGGGGPASAQVGTLEAYRALSGQEGANSPSAEPGGPPREGAAQSYNSIGGDDYSVFAYERIAAEATMLTNTQAGLSTFVSRARALIRAIPAMPGEIVETLREASPDGSALYFLKLTAMILAFLAIAYGLEMQLYGVRLVGPWFIAMQKPNPVGLVEKLPILVARAVIGLIGIAISLILTALLALSVIEFPNEAAEKTAIVVATTVGLCRAAAILWRMVIAPYLPEYRLAQFNDYCARKLFVWVWMTTAISLILLAFGYWMQDLGVSKETHALLIIFGGAIVVVLNVALVMVNRAAITASILDDPAGRAATWVEFAASALWAPIAIIYFIGAFGVISYREVMGIELGVPLIAGAYAVLLAVLVAYGVVAFSIERLFMQVRVYSAARARERAAEDHDQREEIEDTRHRDGELDEGDEEGGTPAFMQVSDPTVRRARARQMRSFEDLARRVATMFAIGAGLYAMIHIWGHEYLLDEGGLLDRAQDVIDIALMSYVIYHAIRIWIDGKIEEEGGAELNLEPGEGEGSGASVSRLATLLPLVRNFLLASVLVSALIMLLIEVGINVAPLFAGAGVVGLAIGFGAQALIRDILSGAFFLIDDAFRKGEYIDIGEVKGTVESISVRSFQLRHHLGMLHTVPFGEITHLTNYSRDWVMVKLPIRVTYDTDIDKVRKLIKKLGQELLDHPVEGAKFLQPLKSQGVYAMEDSAMIIRVKFMTRPGDQWTTRKLIYARIRELFEENGIKFAHREVTVRVADGRGAHLSDEEREAIAGAAREAVDQAEREHGPPAAMASGNR